MSASSIQCPVCTQDVVSGGQPFVCFEVNQRMTRIVPMESVAENTGDVVCLVHEQCADHFEKLVATGIYPPPNLN